MEAPSVRVVPRIGSRPSQARRAQGAIGQLGLTSGLPGREPVITLTSSAMTVLTDRSLEHLVAHELGHVAQLRSPAGRRYQRSVLVGLLLVGAGMLLWLLDAMTALSTGTHPWPWASLVWPIMPCLGLALLRVRRRQEIAADTFAIRLVPDLAAAARLFELEAGADALRAPRRLGAGLLAEHPAPRRALDRMRAQLAGQGG